MRFYALAVLTKTQLSLEKFHPSVSEFITQYTT